jgi:hypothetical protein
LSWLRMNAIEVYKHASGIFYHVLEKTKESFYVKTQIND